MVNAAIVDDIHQPVEWLRSALGLDYGQTPFPWQVDLLQRFLQEKAVTSLDIPTGLGKTATMAVWLVARSLGAPVPRKLVYVVDRRAVVDQATDVAESLRAWVAKERTVADALLLGGRPLPISTLRGQNVDNREWLEDPSAPAIIVGTIDMVGSRLLFSGYGVSSKMRPYHAGMLAADTLVVLDEAHLVPAFEDLLRQIERSNKTFGPKDEAARKLLPSFKLLPLSATGRQTGSTPLTLSEKDRENEVVKKRLNAKKTLTTVELAATPGAAPDDDSESGEDKKVNPQKLVSTLAKQAWDLTKEGSAHVRCLVFCDARKDATEFAAQIRTLAKSTNVPDPAIELFVGARRVRERDHAREALARRGFLAGTPVNLDRSAFLIATSAGEVGVDLDADHMVCDLVAWERMVQRLGRVNRRGNGDAKVVVVVASEPAPSDATKTAIDRGEASRVADKQVDELTKRLSALQADKKVTPTRQRKSDEEKATEEKRKQALKGLKKSISTCQKRIKAFKDADAKAAARYDEDLARYKALRKLLTAVGDGGSLSPEALLQLRQRPDLTKALRDATTAEPLCPELTRALVDAWSMTSLDLHQGRPEVEPWLRGFRPNDPPQTTVVWRRHLPVRHNRRFDQKAAKRFFDAAPPHTSERLETETYRIREWLVARATAPQPQATKSIEKLLEKRRLDGSLSEKNLRDLSAYDAQIATYRTRPSDKDVVAMALTPSGEVTHHWTLERLAAVKGDDAKKLETLLIGATLVVDARLGGLTDGLLDEKANAVAGAADDAFTPWLTRVDVPDVPVTGFRVRPLRKREDDEVDTGWRSTPGDGWVPRHLFVTEKAADGEPLASLAIDGWMGDAATEDERAAANRPQQLDEHQSWAEEAARRIANRLGLDKKYVELLALAARLHDEGKRAARWQRAFRAPLDGRPYAKTKGPIDFAILDGYRHELGSLPYVEKHPEFLKLSLDDQDLVLHLIAAHHGYARPVIGTSGWDHVPPSIVDERARAVGLRFARLSRRWGPWGLAWWEVLLRAADQAASRRNQQDGRASARKGDI